MAAGLLLSAAAYATAAVLGAGLSATMLMAVFVLLSAGIGAAETLSNDVIISAVPAEKAGDAAAISETA